jgi:NADH/NAD ratio-sensing transcriptional regulator Rex
MPERNRISKPAARRLSQYLRTLQSRLDGDAPANRVSSRELGEQAGVADAQVRKDLASFGAGGQPGVGYQVRALHDGLRRALGLDKPWRAVLVRTGCFQGGENDPEFPAHHVCEGILAAVKFVLGEHDML